MTPAYETYCLHINEYGILLNTFTFWLSPLLSRRNNSHWAVSKYNFHCIRCRQSPRLGSLICDLFCFILSRLRKNETRNLYQYITIGALKQADTKEYCGHNALFMNKYSKVTHSHLCVSVNGPIIWLSITVLDLNGLRFHRWLAFIFLFINWLFSWIIYSYPT